MQEINSAYKAVSQLVGRQGQHVLGKKQFLDSVTKIDKDLAKTIEKSVEGVTNPTFELSGKATANYNIAGLKIRNGNQEIIGTGAVSKSQPDLLQASEIKGRFDLPNGEMIRIEGTLNEYENSLNVYTRKDKNLKRICSAVDDTYMEPVRKFGIGGDIEEYRVFYPKENKIKPLYKYKGCVMEDIKVTSGKNGITKIETKWSKDSPLTNAEFYDAKGNLVAMSSYLNNSQTRIDRIINKKSQTTFEKITNFDSQGNAYHAVYEYWTKDYDQILMSTSFDIKTGEESVGNILIKKADKTKYTPFFPKHYPQEIRELLSGKTKEYDVTGLVDEMNDIIMKTYDRYTENLMK